MDQELCLPDNHAPTICRFDNPNFWRIKSWGPLIGCGPSPTSSKISCMHGVLWCATTTKQLSSTFTTSVFSFNLLTIDKLVYIWLHYFKKKLIVNVQFYQVSGLPFFFFNVCISTRRVLFNDCYFFIFIFIYCWVILTTDCVQYYFTYLISLTLSSLWSNSITTIGIRSWWLCITT